ncbi:MAG: DUF1499 domain-containing protein [Anaerolineae bacterium]
MMWIVYGIIAVVALTLIGRFFVVPAAATMPDNLGWRDNGFVPCPPTPNCVSSTAPADGMAYIEPIAFEGSPESAYERLTSVLDSLPRAERVSDDGRYLHVVFRSLTMGFPDDTEFYIDAENNVIHVRSAARLGAGDMGVNRNRIEQIRQQF